MPASQTLDGGITGTIPKDTLTVQNPYGDRLHRPNQSSDYHRVQRVTEVYESDDDSSMIATPAE